MLSNPTVGLFPDFVVDGSLVDMCYLVIKVDICNPVFELGSLPNNMVLRTKFPLIDRLTFSGLQPICLYQFLLVSVDINFLDVIILKNWTFLNYGFMMRLNVVKKYSQNL